MKRIIAILCLLLILITNTSFHEKKFSNSYYIIIDKSKYELSVIDSEGWLATYPVVFGNGDLKDKMMDGDRETPEGLFTIVSKHVHNKWDRMLMIDYPTKTDSSKFFERIQHGLIPSDAKIGGGIGIHGVWKHEDYVVDKYQNWTDGCISMKNEDVEELYNTVPVGTKVLIRK
jgi:lipoprotein-anchoring transpeptidase ErfK/SrfK